MAPIRRARPLPRTLFYSAPVTTAIARSISGRFSPARGFRYRFLGGLDLWRATRFPFELAFLYEGGASRIFTISSYVAGLRGYDLHIRFRLQSFVSEFRHARLSAYSTGAPSYYAAWLVPSESEGRQSQTSTRAAEYRAPHTLFEPVDIYSIRRSLR